MTICSDESEHTPGTSTYGILDVVFPENAIFVSQILYGSIGWTVGRTLLTLILAFGES